MLTKEFVQQYAAIMVECNTAKTKTNIHIDKIVNHGERVSLDKMWTDAELDRGVKDHVFDSVKCVVYKFIRDNQELFVK